MVLAEKEMVNKMGHPRCHDPGSMRWGKTEQEKSRDQLNDFGLSKGLEDYNNMKSKLPLSSMQII